MSDTITTATATATTTSTNYGEIIKVPMTMIDPGVASIAICGGPNYCPYKVEMEKDTHKKVKKEIYNKMFSEHPQPRYGGAFYSLDEKGKTILIYLKKIIYNAPATIAFWSDDTKTVCKCDPRDEYDPEKGLLLCQMKKMCGGESVHKLLEDWTTACNHSIVTLADVRRKHR